MLPSLRGQRRVRRPALHYPGAQEGLAKEHGKIRLTDNCAGGGGLGLPFHRRDRCASKRSLSFGARGISLRPRESGGRDNGVATESNGFARRITCAVNGKHCSRYHVGKRQTFPEESRRSHGAPMSSTSTPSGGVHSKTDAGTLFPSKERKSSVVTCPNPSTSRIRTGASPSR